MKWDMELEEIEAVLEKIWDLHDKLSDAIHSISRSHFLSSIKPLKTNNKKLNNESDVGFEDNNSRSSNRASGFVFVKDFRVDENDLSAIQEAKSLNSIRTALENLEDQLEFFHTVQIHQRAERDAAIARLEQSRIILAMRLAEHHGKKYQVLEEALAFVGDVHDSSRFVCPENLYGLPKSPSGENLVRHEEKRPNTVIKVLLSSFEFAKKSLQLDHVGGILGNAALFTVSMIAMLHLHQVAQKDHPYKQEDLLYSNRNGKKASGPEGSSPNGSLNHLDVMLARG
ncbi:unnamed protein product [Dovyalis caffra]|uniref:Plastid division protein PDV1 n=1 Tax=Dovyalis caffra TaxID=77055 RepID=A0AAV1QVE3_9ROSI|nr:unnamed protein product [Dovyalis caffra]